MDEKILTPEEQRILDKKERAADYCKMIEAKLRKAEKDIWMVKDHTKH